MRDATGDRSRRRGGLRGFGRIVLQLGLTALVTWFILRGVGFDLEALRGFDLSDLKLRPVSLWVSVGVLLLAFIVSASLWGVMVREIGVAEVGFVAALRVFFTANLGRYIPGKLWQIAGLAYLAKGEGVHTGTAIGSAVLGQAFSLGGATLLGAGVLLGVGRGGEQSFGWGAVVVMVVLLGATSPGILKRILPFWFRLARQPYPATFRPDHAFGLRWMGLYALVWGGQGLAFWLLCRGLGFDLPLLQAASAYSAAYVLGYLFLPAPAGVGVREGVLVGILGPSLGPGVAIVAVVARLWTTLVELLPALFLAGGYLRRPRPGGGNGG